MNNKLVSILVACYNGGNTVCRLLNSILEQTYRPIEIVFVNDGSIDDTEKIIEGYRTRFGTEGISLVYHYQENKGLGGAVDTALKLFSGDYICFADADDFLAPKSIEKRVQCLQEHPEYGCVTTDAYCVKEGDILKPIRRVSESFSNNEDENQFLHLLKGESIFCNGAHMLRTESFLKINPIRSIYPARRGQNWQVLLPMYYHYKRYFLNEPLFYYVVSQGSMSRGDDMAKKKLYRCDEHEDILTHVLQSIQMGKEERERYLNIVKINYARTRLSVAFKYCMPEVARVQFALLRERKAASFRDRVRFWGAKYPWINRLLLKSNSI